MKSFFTSSRDQTTQSNLSEVKSYGTKFGIRQTEMQLKCLRLQLYALDRFEKSIMQPKPGSHLETTIKNKIATTAQMEQNLINRLESLQSEQLNLAR